jgi:RNA polymerase sigma-70 factor (ECF subfamily)
VRNLAAMQARGAARRRARETAWQAVDDAVETAPASSASLDVAVLSRLPPAARRVAILALHGLGPEEVRWILGLSATAFRQRLTSIRKSLGQLPEPLRAEAIALAYVRDPARAVELSFGLVRRALKAALHGGDGLATHDPDGHLMVLRHGAHISPARGN